MKPFDKMYQIFLFKNSTDGPLIDLSLDDVYNIDGNSFINTFNTKKISPKIFFLSTQDIRATEFSKLLKPTSESSIFFLWDSPIDYNVQNIDKIKNDIASSDFLTDWGNIFIYNLHKYDSDYVRYSTDILGITDNIITINCFTTKFTVKTYLSTDDIYIDCAPINESVTNVNYYLEKLDGKNNAIITKMQGMILNSLILVIVSGSVYFSTPKIFEILISFHPNNELNKNEILSGIAIGLGFELVLITIVIMSVGISKKKQDLLFASFILLIITLSFIVSFTNTPSIADSLHHFSLYNILIYMFYPLSYAAYAAYAAYNKEDLLRS